MTDPGARSLLPEPGPPEAPPPRRKWPRRLLKAVLFLALLPLLLRLTLPLYLPPLLSSGANMLGLELEYEAIDVSVLDASFHARGVVVTPIEGGAPIVTVESVQARLDPRALRQGRFHYYEVQIRGLDGVLVLGEDGKLALQDRIEDALYGDGKRKRGSGNDSFLYYEHMHVEDSRIRWIDRSVSPTVDAKFEVELTAREWNSVRKPYWPRELELYLGSEERPRAARITSKTDGDETRIRLQIKGLDAPSAAPYFARSGWKTDARSLDVDVGWRTRPPTRNAARDLRLEDVALSADGREVLRLTAGTMRPAYGTDLLDLGKIELAGLQLHATREADGSMRWSGFERIARSSERGSGSGSEIQALLLQASRITLRDRTVHPPSHLAFGLRRFEVGFMGSEGGDAVPFKGELFVPHLAGSVAMVGSFTWTERTEAVTVRIDADRVTGRALAPYLEGSGVAPDLLRARVRFDLDWALSRALETSAYAQRVEVRGFEIFQDEQALVRFDDLLMDADRIDPTARSSSYSTFRLRGLEADFVAGADGVIRGAGLTLDPDAVRRETEPWRSELKSLAVQVRRSRLSSSTRPAGILMRDMRVTSEAPLVLDTHRPQDSAPLLLSLSGEVAPLSSRCVVSARVRPLGKRPSAEVEVELGGLRGAGLFALVPELAEWYTVDTLTDGVLKAGLSLTRTAANPAEGVAGPRAFGLIATLRNASLRPRSEEPVAFSLDAARLDVESYDPDSGSLEASRLEWVHPRMTIRRDSGGLRLLGLRRKPAPDEQVKIDPEDAPGPERRVALLKITGGELDYSDERAYPFAPLPLRGLDAEVRGLSTRALREPRPVTFRVTAAAGSVALPWRKSPKGTKRSAVVRTLTGGVIEPPTEERAQFDSRPAFADAELSGKLTLAPHWQGRAVLDVGNLELPNFRGLAKANGIEVRSGLLGIHSEAHFRGAARTKLESELTFDGLEVSEPLGGGVGEALGLPAPLDAVVAAVRDGDGVIRVPVTAHLDPEGRLVSAETYQLVLEAMGPVVGRAFRDSVIKLTRKLADLGETMLQFLPDSLRKVLRSEKRAAPTTVRLDFAPGAISLPGREQMKLGLLVRHLRKGAKLELRLAHELGAEDWERLERRANPSEADLKALLDRLDARQGELLRRRSRIRGRAESALAREDASGLGELSPELRLLDAALGNLEAARDKAGALLTERSRWDTRERTRAAARALGAARLEFVAQLLRSQEQLVNLSGRLNVRTPGDAVAQGVAIGGVHVVPRQVRDK